MVALHFFHTTLKTRISLSLREFREVFDDEVKIIKGKLMDLERPLTFTQILDEWNDWSPQTDSSQPVWKLINY